MKKEFVKHYESLPQQAQDIDHADDERNSITKALVYRLTRGRKPRPGFPCAIAEGAEKRFMSLLQICDNLAEQLRGSIHGVVDYGASDAYIELVVPYLELSTCADMDILKDLSEKAVTVLFQCTEDGKLRVLLTVSYFHNFTHELADFSSIRQEDMTHIALTSALATLSKPIQNSFTDLANILHHIVEATNLSPKEVVPVFLGEMEGREIDLTDISGARNVANDIVTAFLAE